MHLHDYVATMRLGEATFDLKPGDLTITPAGMPSSYDLDRPGRHWCVHFYPGAGDGPGVHTATHLRLGPAASHVADRISQITRLHAQAEQGDRDPLAGWTASAMFLELILWCAARSRSPEAGRNDIADRVAELIEIHASEALSVSRLAKLTGHPQHTIARVFRARFGVTIPRYLLQRRLAQARNLLENSDLPVGLIGQRVGIADPQYFNKLSRRLLGASPSQIRAASRQGFTHPPA